MSVPRTRVKVCGLCSPTDARAAARAGADALGVILVPGSPRHVTIAEAAAIFEAAPASLKRVGVFVDSPLEDVAAAAVSLGLSAVQLHGSESPGYCRRLQVPVIKSFRVGAAFDPRRVEQYRGVVAAILLDTLVEGVAGGSGRAFDWESVAGMPHVAPLVVAGGLAPSNVGAAIRALRPCAVDVSSGVEETVRHKDPERLAAFITAVREADDTREACA